MKVTLQYSALIILAIVLGLLMLSAQIWVYATLEEANDYYFDEPEALLFAWFSINLLASFILSATIIRSLLRKTKIAKFIQILSFTKIDHVGKIIFNQERIDILALFLATVPISIIILNIIHLQDSYGIFDAGLSMLIMQILLLSLSFIFSSTIIVFAFKNFVKNQLVKKLSLIEINEGKDILFNKNYYGILVGAIIFSIASFLIGSVINVLGTLIFA